MKKFMKKGFEETFMDAQASTVSVSLELLDINNIKADKVYIYLYQSNAQLFYHAFFEKEKKIYRLNDLFSDEQIHEYFACLQEDLSNIVDVCNSFGKKCPCEFRLIYNINTGSFDSKYNYDDITSNGKKDLVDIYLDWRKECEDALNK